MKYFLLLVLAMLLQACEQALPEEVEQPRHQTIVENYAADLEQLLQTVQIGETAEASLTDYTKLPNDQYEKPPVTLTVKNGLVDSVTLFIEEALTLDDVLPFEFDVQNTFDRYEVEWLTTDESIHALRLTLSEPTLQQQIANMQLDEKIGQLVLTGFDGTNITPVLREAIEEAKIGHVILFSKNITNAQQLKALNSALLALNTSQPLWISIDEEGGRVSRIPKEFTKLPPAAKLATAYSADEVEKLAALQAELLQAYGFTVNFAPVLDINSNPKNPVIGNRAFSQDIDTVNRYALAFTKGLRSNGILGVGKHFPGHGDTKTDSHYSLPVINRSIEQLRTAELVPFQYAIDQGIEMLMIGHLLLPALDTQHVASASPKIMTHLLREEMGFDGVIITDDLTMQAIDSPIPQAAVQAIIAGADIALIGHGTSLAIEATKALNEAVQDGRLTEQQINERVYRILRLKQRYSGTIDEAFDRDSWQKRLQEFL